MLNRFVRGGATIPAWLGSFLLLAWTPVSGQLWERLSNPKFTVPIEHPPQVVLKPGTKIALRELAGPCGQELGDRINQATFASRRFDVVERAQLESVLREINFQTSGGVSAEGAVRANALLGPAAMVIGRVNRCSVDVSPMLRESYETVKQRQRVIVTKFIRRASGYATGVIRLVDLSTGRLLAAHEIDAKVTRQTESTQGDPEPPDTDLVRTALYDQAVADFMKVIAPWTEEVTLTVYDDKDWELKQSAQQMKAGDFVGATATVQAAIEKYLPTMDARKDQKTLAHAYYNLGIALLYSNRPDEALKALQQSEAARSSEIAREGMAAARKTLALRARARALEAQAIDLGAPAEAAQGATRAADTAASLTNQDVVDMVRLKLPESVIVAKIKSTKGRFDTSPKALGDLKNAGASDTILLAVMEAATKIGSLDR